MDFLKIEVGIRVRRIVVGWLACVSNDQGVADVVGAPNQAKHSAQMIHRCYFLIDTRSYRCL